MSANLTISTPRTPAPPVRRDFPLGQLLATPGALEALKESGQHAAEFISRHMRLEQGELCDSDQAANECALLDGSRIFSSFKTAKGEKLWIITEAADEDGERSATTILLPEEY